MNFECVADCKYIVIGDPIAHSKSPEMQNAGLQALKLRDKYGKLHVRSEDMDEFVAWAKINLKGFNITVPHKERIIPYLDQIDPIAQAANSCNTVCCQDGKLSGYSTDGYGLEMAITEAFQQDLTGQNVLFLGTGGAASSAAFHFASRNIAKLMLANRTGAKAETLALNIKKHFPNLEIEFTELANQAKLQEMLRQTTLLIQGTSLGLKPTDNPPFPLEMLPSNPKLAVFDTIYLNTPLLQNAQKLGIRATDGRWMLLHQGARSLEIWTKKSAPVEVMRNALERSLTCNS